MIDEFDKNLDGSVSLDEFVVRENDTYPPNDKYR